jgi:hypothetical protein
MMGLFEALVTGCIMKNQGICHAKVGIPPSEKTNLGQVIPSFVVQLTLLEAVSSLFIEFP